MLRNFLHSKIHRATVTEANVNYVGSLSIDEELMELAGIEVNEVVHLANVTTGERLTTYAIPAPRGSRILGANGAAAHKMQVGDIIIVFTFSMLTDAERLTHAPRLLFVDADNNPVANEQEERHGELSEALLLG